MLNESITLGAEIFYWRENNKEVDFVISYKQKMIGLEVKSGSHNNQIGLAAFQKQYPKAEFLLVGKEGLTLDKFFKMKLVELFER